MIRFINLKDVIKNSDVVFYHPKRKANGRIYLAPASILSKKNICRANEIFCF